MGMPFVCLCLPLFAFVCPLFAFSRVGSSKIKSIECLDRNKLTLKEMNFGIEEGCAHDVPSCRNSENQIGKNIII